jgi:hypothetical protein
MVRRPHWYTSVKDRFAMTMYARAYAVSPISRITSASGAAGRKSSKSPMASPRLVTGAALHGFNRSHAILGTSGTCVATHPSDAAVAFAALEARVYLLGPDGERQVPFVDFLLPPGNTPDREQALRRGELITAVEIPALPRPLKSGYLKVRDRQSYEFALTSAAVALHVRGGVIREAKVAAGGVGTVPWKLPAVEQHLVGERPSGALWSAAAAKAADGARPLQHHRFKVELLKRSSPVRSDQETPPEYEGAGPLSVVVDVGADPATGKCKQLTRTFGTLREAKVEYARITNRRYEGTFVEPDKITVNEWLDQWLDRKAEDLEESTVYTMTLGRVRGKLGHIRLQELTEDHVEAWMRGGGFGRDASWWQGGRGPRGDLGGDVPGAVEGGAEPGGGPAPGRRGRCPGGHDPSEGTQGGTQGQGGGAALERRRGSCLRARGEGRPPVRGSPSVPHGPAAGGDLRYALGRCRPGQGRPDRCQHPNAHGEQDRGGEGHEVSRR